MKTLVVEDDFVNRQILVKMLDAFGSCDVAGNGREALEAFTLGHQEGKPYDLICLDILMPLMDGQNVLSVIRTKESHMRITHRQSAKIIMISALQDRGNIIQAFKTGCESYLVKPVEKEKLVEEIRKLGLLDPVY